MEGENKQKRRGGKKKKKNLEGGREGSSKRLREREKRGVEEAGIGVQMLCLFFFRIRER